MTDLAALLKYVEQEATEWREAVEASYASKQEDFVPNPSDANVARARLMFERYTALADLVRARIDADLKL